MPHRVGVVSLGNAGILVCLSVLTAVLCLAVAPFVQAADGTRFVGGGSPTVPQSSAQQGSAAVAPSKPSLAPGGIGHRIRPDLTVDAFGPSGQFGLSVFTHNNGLADAGPFTIAFHCEYWVDKNFKEECALPKITVPGLAKGATDTRRLPLSLSMFKDGHHYSFMITVDADKQITELNESNNTAFASFTLP